MKLLPGCIYCATRTYTYDATWGKKNKKTRDAVFAREHFTWECETASSNNSALTLESVAFIFWQDEFDEICKLTRWKDDEIRFCQIIYEKVLWHFDFSQKKSCPVISQMRKTVFNYYFKKQVLFSFTCNFCQINILNLLHDIFILLSKKKGNKFLN